MPINWDHVNLIQEWEISRNQIISVSKYLLESDKKSAIRSNSLLRQIQQKVDAGSVLENNKH